MERGFLIAEAMILFVGLPLAYRFSPWRVPALPLLWLVSAYAWWQLAREKSFDQRQLWNVAELNGHLGSILAIFLVIAALLWVGVRQTAPQLEWGLIRRRPALWAAVMALYPVLSVYPQGVLYRAFFLDRYAVLFPSTQAGEWTLLLASAAAFGFLHVIFRNWFAVLLSFAGGILFAWRYRETGSLLTSSLEHSLYGCWLLTVGLGQYFYHGFPPKSR